MKERGSKREREDEKERERERKEVFQSERRSCNGSVRFPRPCILCLDLLTHDLAMKLFEQKRLLLITISIEIQPKKLFAKLTGFLNEFNFRQTARLSGQQKAYC